jgi:hypothetical protein
MKCGDIYTYLEGFRFSLAFNCKCQKKVPNGIFHGRGPMERPRLRWENNTRRHFSFLLNMRVETNRRRLRYVEGELMKKRGPDADHCAIEKQEEEEEEEEEEEIFNWGN